MQIRFLSRALAAHVTEPRLRVELRGPAAKVSWVTFCSGRMLACLEIQNGHKRLGMERTTTSSLVRFQPFQPRSKYALTKTKGKFESFIFRCKVHLLRQRPLGLSEFI